MLKPLDLALAKAVSEVIHDQVTPLRALLESQAKELAGARQEIAQLRERLDTQPAPRDGIDGKDGANGLDGKDGRDGIDGKDGQNGIDGKDGLNGKDGEPGKDGIDGKDGQPGADGKDGLHGKDGQDGAAGKDGHDGFGFEHMEIEWDGERTITHKYVRGEEVKTVDIVVPWPLYQEVYKAGKDYRKGDMVSYGGSVFIAQRDTNGIPETPDSGWRLAVKRGRDGKNGKDGERGERGPEGPRGRDLTQMTFEGQRY